MSDFCGNKIGCVRHTTPHWVVACTAVFADWHSQQCMRALLFYLHKVQEISTFQQRSFLLTCIQPPSPCSIENDSGSPEAEVILPCASAVISFTFQEISMFTPWLHCFPCFFLYYDIAHQHWHSRLTLFLKGCVNFVSLVQLIDLYQWSILRILLWITVIKCFPPILVYTHSLTHHILNFFCKLPFLSTCLPFLWRKKLPRERWTFSFIQVLVFMQTLDRQRQHFERKDTLWSKTSPVLWEFVESIPVLKEEALKRITFMWTMSRWGLI